MKRLGKAITMSLAALGCAIAPSHAADPVKVGFVMSYSGWFQPIDASSINGALLAIKEINAKGGLLGSQIEVVKFDNKSEPPLGADGAVEVIGKGAKAILFPSDFDFGAPGAFIAQQSNVVSLSGASDPKFGVTGIGPYAYSISNAAQSQGALLAEWAYKEKGWRSSYVLLDNTISFTKSLCGSFSKRWKELAGDAALAGEDTFLNGDPSVSAQVTRITSLSAKPDFVVLCSYAPGGPSAIRQLRAAGIDQPILANTAMVDNYWLNAVPGLKDFYLPAFMSLYGDDPRPEMNKFLESHKARYGEAPVSSYSVLGYSLIEQWAYAVEQAKTTESEAVVGVMNSFKDQPFTAGPTSFTDQLHIQVDRPWLIMKVENGSFHAVEVYRNSFKPDMKLLFRVGQ